MQLKLLDTCDKYLTVTFTLEITAKCVYSCDLLERSFETNPKAPHGRILYACVTLKRERSNKQPRKKNRSNEKTSMRVRWLAQCAMYYVVHSYSVWPIIRVWMCLLVFVRSQWSGDSKWVVILFFSTINTIKPYANVCDRLSTASMRRYGVRTCRAMFLSLFPCISLRDDTEAWLKSDKK